jgi:hypothetical protein
MMMIFRKCYEIFLFLIGEKLTKINLIHMCMFYIDLSYRLLLMRLSHLKLAEISNRMKILY